MSIIRTLRTLTSAPLNREHKLRALVRYAKWQVGSRLVPGKVLVDWVDGVSFIAGPGDHGLTGNIYRGLHEFDDMAFVIHALDADDLFVDVGANAGSYTLLACGVAGAAGQSFEPVPSTYAKLVLNLALNDLLGSVQPLNVGVGAEQGRLRFTSAQDCTNHVLADGESDPNVVEVPVVTLDESLSAPPSLMKIDVEGFETMVLKGASKTLADPRLNAILIELNGSGNRYGFDEEAIVQSLVGYGFRQYAYSPFTRSLDPLGKSHNVSGNTLFVRDLERAVSKIRRAPKRRILGTEL